jgi:hypothetical protein
MTIVDLLSDMAGDLEDDSGYPAIAKAMRGWLNSAPPQVGVSDILRASGMFFLCPREYVLHYWDPKPTKKFNASAQMRMQVGTDLHTYFQNNVLGPMGILWGEWFNTEEECWHEGFHPDPEESIWAMQKQVGSPWVFCEETVWDPKSRILGHLDGRVSKNKMEFLAKNLKLMKSGLPEALKECEKVPDDELVLCEIKSTGTFAFNGLTDVSKIPDYNKMQASIYQKLSGTSETIFLYVERDNLKLRGFSYEGESGWVKDAERKAHKIWESIRDETLPESMMPCSSPSDKRAKGCAYKKECWDTYDFKAWVAARRSEGEANGRVFLELSEKCFDV